MKSREARVGLLYCLQRMDVYYVRHLVADRWRALSREQQLSVIVFGVCGCFALAASIVSLREHIYSPFTAPKSVLVKAAALQKELNESDDAYITEQQKRKDSDHDGLSDYAELVLYRTSPYLADSDSDGIPDVVEIAQVTDPNCPQGKTCTDPSLGVITGASTGTASDLLSATRVPQAPNDFGGTAVSSSSALNDMPPDPAGMTTDQIRTYLISRGLLQPDQSTLLDDAQLRQAYSAAYAQALRVQQARTTPINP